MIGKGLKIAGERINEGGTIMIPILSRRKKGGGGPDKRGGRSDGKLRYMYYLYTHAHVHMHMTSFQLPIKRICGACINRPFNYLHILCIFNYVPT